MPCYDSRDQCGHCDQCEHYQHDVNTLTMYLCQVLGELDNRSIQVFDQLDNGFDIHHWWKDHKQQDLDHGMEEFAELTLEQRNHILKNWKE